MKKKCTKCKITKDFSLFYNQKQRKDGKQSNCKACRHATNNEYRKRNPEKYKKWNKRKRTKENAKKSITRSRRIRKVMSDSYIRDLITMGSDIKKKDVSDDLIKLWRVNLTLKRMLRLTKKLKES